MFKSKEVDEEEYEKNGEVGICVEECQLQHEEEEEYPWSACFQKKLKKNMQKGK